MRLIITELRTTKRNVVTNLAVNVPRLCEYLEQTYPDESIDVVNRIWLLSVDETKVFWKHRGPYQYAGIIGFPGSDDVVESDGKQGVLFVIDEAGAAGFDANGWAQSDGRTSRGQDCAWYLDQQRKFGDDVYASQNGRRPAGIAKPFRDKAHSFIRLKNGYLQTYGMFKGRGRFTATHYTHEPDKSSEPMKEETWQMDAVGIASCYRTQDGVGVKGVAADIGKKAKGIPIVLMIPIAVVAGLILAVGLPMLLSRSMSRMSAKKRVGEGSPAVVQAVEPVVKKVDASPIAAGFPPSGSMAPAVAPSPSVLLPSHGGSEFGPSRPTVTGVIRTGQKVTVNLSDGRVFSEGEEYLRLERTFVESPRGTRYYFARPATNQADRTQKNERAKTGSADANASPVLERQTEVGYSGEALFPAFAGNGRSDTSTGEQNPVAWSRQRQMRR